MCRLVAALGAVMILSTSIAVGIAHARTPGPTSTAAPTAFTTPGPTPTLSPQQMAVFQGFAWVNAQFSAERITARINDLRCAEATQESLTVGTSVFPSGFLLEVPSDEIKPGCGREGETVTFFVGGERASQTAVWRAGTWQSLGLTVGAPFARFSTRFLCDERLYRAPPAALVPYVRDAVCGGWETSSAPQIYGLPQSCYLKLNVYSQEQRVGCGTEGAEVTFKLVDGQGNTLATAEQKGIWHAWDGMRDTSQILDLTLMTPGGIRIGSVGTGDSQERDGTVAVVTLGLAIAGITTIVAGATLRKRAIKRNS